jgi:ABC-type multidrug transport system fused ATPase/permease subunit
VEIIHVFGEEGMTIPSFFRSRFFIAGCLFAAAGVLSVLWAVRLMESVSDYRSPLHAAPPLVQEPLGHAVSQRLIIILVDGLRDDTSHDEELMPYLAALREQGAWATMHSQPPSYSQPGYSTLMIGAWPDINDGPVLNEDLDKIQYWTQDNLFTAVHRAGGRTAIAAHETFEMLIPPPDLDDSFFTEECNQAGDDLIFNQALPWVKAGGQSLLLIHLCQVDDAGDYLGGPNSKAWADAATRVDAMIQMIGAQLDFTKDTLMVVSDHGQIDAGGHGGPEALNLQEPFILAGAGIWPGYFGNVEMVDVAPTAAALLGVSIPATAQGRVLDQMILLSYEVESTLSSAEENQQKQLYQYYARMIDTSASLNEAEADPVVKYEDGIARARSNRLRGEQLGRVFLIFFPAVIAAYFIWKYRSRRMLERILLFLLYALIFTAVYMFAFRQTFSLSRAQTETGFILAIFVSSAAGFLASWAAYGFLRRYFSDGLESIAENTLALAGVFMSLLALFVAAHFLLNGTVAVWTLPEWNSAFFGFLAMIQIFTLAAVAGLIAGGIGIGKWAAVARSESESGVKNFIAAPVKREPKPRPAPGRKRTGRGPGRRAGRRK